MHFRPKKGKSDAELLNLYLAKGDLKPLGELYNRYLELVYGLCLKYLSSPENAEDATMAIFEQLPAKVKKQSINDFRPWLYVVAKHHCLMQLRKKKNNQEIRPDIMQSEALLHPFSISDKEKEELQFQKLEHCLKTLSQQQKNCVELFYLQEYSYQEIANQLSWTLGKVRSNLQNGRRNLKICIEALIAKENEK